MRGRAKRVLVITVASVLALLLVVSDRPPAPRIGPGPDAPTAVVALGDSTMAGEGAGDYEPGTRGENGDWCHRSTRALVHRLGVPGVDTTINLACSGANSAQVGLGDAVQYTEPSQAARLGALAREHRVLAVVVAVGANDEPRFADILNRCVQAWLGRGAECGDAMAQEWPLRINAMIPRIERALRDIQSVMRDAGYLDSSYSLVVQSYAAPLAPGFPASLQNFSGCPFRGSDLRWVQETGITQLAEGIRTAARRTGARYLDLSRAGTGHEACTGGEADSGEWFTRLTVDWASLNDQARAGHAMQESFHPNDRGHAQFGRCLGRFLVLPAREAACVPGASGNLDLRITSPTG
ncbi:GDSL-type esterase/lipase family protein [Goodfellowiella coeruleoviolacea]|uniref:GDSL-like Lipase/Acylhydrolase family protein n=1 Tax=Goodfellowiella coeruleoviolacea TaxID=334858 RepID=A0AAE3GFZ9_9PSEU|nr:GDSL-type esterase/lipase family protein [Goodfellowiella coeruleoviolacea]MCP2167521.1 GDSL-like Lipase/Acylhydrolase family protein [Goodfellowiella coeruleoviolacea]